MKSSPCTGREWYFEEILNSRLPGTSCRRRRSLVYPARKKRTIALISGGFERVCRVVREQGLYFRAGYRAIAVFRETAGRENRALRSPRVSLREIKRPLVLVIHSG